MSTENENVILQTKNSETPEIMAKIKPQTKADDKPEEKAKSDNYSCCGSCSE